MELLLPNAPALPIPLNPSELSSFPELQHVPRAYDLRLTDPNSRNAVTASSSGARNLYAFKERRPPEDVEEEERQKKLKRDRGEDSELDDDDEDLMVDDEDDEDIVPLSSKGKGKAKATDWSSAGQSSSNGEKRKRVSKFRRE
jgi:hypothetical protein